MSVYKPHSEEKDNNSLNIFLGGTIDMGLSRNWQGEFCQRLENIFGTKNVTIFNPRRDSGTGVKPGDTADLRYQIQWELSHLDKSDIIVFNLLPESKSPITLMEIGLYANSDKGVFVICPESFYRYDNVFMVCSKFRIPLLHSEEDFFQIIKTNFRLKK